MIRIIDKIVLENGNINIGHAQICKIDHHNKKARISRILIGDKRYRGKGLSSLIIKELLSVVFVELNLFEVELFVLKTNNPAITCYRKSGFQIKNSIEDYVVKGEIIPLYEMTISKEKWVEVGNLN